LFNKVYSPEKIEMINSQNLQNKAFQIVIEYCHYSK
jgi:hypothetical protein